MCFYIAVLSITFFFVSKLSNGNPLNLAMNIDTHCFGALEAVTGAQTSPHVLAWKTGSDYSYCFASKLLTGSVVS